MSATKDAGHVIIVGDKISDDDLRRYFKRFREGLTGVKRGSCFSNTLET